MIVFKRFKSKVICGANTTIFFKEVNGAFFTGRPFRKYTPAKWKDWRSILDWCKMHGYYEVRTKPLSELEWLDKVQMNFEE